MIYLRRFVRFCCTLLILLLLCSACSTTTEAENGDVGSVVSQEDVNYEEIAVAAVETALKNRLKNPESLQIHSANLEGGSFEDDAVYFCTVVVDYSAQNSFGGYNRETVKSFIEIVKADGAITELDEVSYLNRRTKAQFGDGLCSVGEGIPLQLIFSEDNYSRLLSNIRGSGKISSTFTYPSGDKEVCYISNLGNLEGTATFYFCSKSEKIYQINFYWSDEQSFYDGTNAYTLGSEYIATLEDVDALREKIDDTLEISHVDIKETTETYFHDYECRWNLAEGIYIKLSWSTNDTNGNIGHIQLLLTNEINKAAG